MEFPYKIIVTSEVETMNLAEEFSRIISTGDVIALNGELGAGKTFFVKSLCSNFNINNVSSPSFAIVNEYSGMYKIYHFDFYRIKKSIELYDIGFEDYINDDAIIFIEWAEMMEEILPDRRYEIKFELLCERKREITIIKNE